jgi:hypothetical protein
VQKSSLWQLQRSQVRIAESHARFLHLYRAENLYYQFKHGQELLPQLRQIICLLARFRSLFSIVATIIARACFACRLDSSLRSE